MTTDEAAVEALAVIDATLARIERTCAEAREQLAEARGDHAAKLGSALANLEQSLKAARGTRQVVVDLNAVIAELEGARVDVRRELGRAHGTQAEALAIALKRLEDKRTEALQKRERLVNPLRRAIRLREVAAERKQVQLELARLAETGDGAPRLEQLRERERALDAEEVRLRAPRGP